VSLPKLLQFSPHSSVKELRKMQVASSGNAALIAAFSNQESRLGTVYYVSAVLVLHLMM